MRRLSRIFYLLSFVLYVAGCNIAQIEEETLPFERVEISLTGEIEQENTTKADDMGFADKDEIGIYVVDYEGSVPGILKNKGNRADNVKHILDVSANKWNPLTPIYWKDDQTHIDIYGFYPYSKVNDVNNYSFSVSRDQSAASEGGLMGGYEASDFLWSKAENIAPTSTVIRLPFRHLMASINIILREGSGYEEDEWDGLTKNALVLNTSRQASIDLSAGIVRSSVSADGYGIVPSSYGDAFRAIVVPQTVEAGKELISVTVGGYSYTLAKSVEMVYNPGRQHNFTITVNKKKAGSLEFVLSDESIVPWENDLVSHDYSTKAYLMIDVDQPGVLREKIIEKGLSLEAVVNLKVSGPLNSKDLGVMRFQMKKLKRLNLRDARLVKSDGCMIDVDGREFESVPIPDDDVFTSDYSEYDGHFYGFRLNTIVLPSQLKAIEPFAFRGCSFVGSLILPEGLERIGAWAFRDTGFSGTLTLPSSLKVIESEAFSDCGFIGDLIIPEGVTRIEDGVFAGCGGFTSVRIPENVTYIGDRCFFWCYGISGHLEIPQGVVSIGFEAFSNTSLNGVLVLHEGLEEIRDGAFAGAHIKAVEFPSTLRFIGNSAFSSCDLGGDLVLPANLEIVGAYAFSNNWRLSGIVEFPSKVLNVPEGMFEGCSSIEGVILHKDIDFIGRNAFNHCFYMNTITCKGIYPPIVMDGAFDGVPKDNFTLVVPEVAFDDYKSAGQWSEFKRISPYADFVCRPGIATAINTSVTRRLVLNSEHDWEVYKLPEWLSIDKTEGGNKTEVNLTFSRMPAGQERADTVIFMQKDTGYKTYCLVSQYDYEYEEDEIVTLQRSTVGNGVNLVFLGDGYSAKDVSSGTEMSDIEQAVEHFFSIEPFNTYREYFNVYTGVSVSTESGIGTVNTIRYNRFNTTAKGGVTLGGRNGESDFAEIFEYAKNAPTVNDSNLSESLIVMIPNTTNYGGISYLWDEGAAIAYCPMSDYGYPYDFRGVIQHEAGGHGFGKLGDEYIYHNEFIDACPCTCCPHDAEFKAGKDLGWYDNLSLTGKMKDVPWAHLIFHDKYKQIVDVWEGGYMHSRGVYRSEYNSCMNNDIPYYSTISRESIVKRIMRYAGEVYSFESFVLKDNMGTVTTKSTAGLEPVTDSRSAMAHSEPVHMGKLFR